MPLLFNNLLDTFMKSNFTREIIQAIVKKHIHTPLQFFYKVTVFKFVFFGVYYISLLIPPL